MTKAIKVYSLVKNGELTGAIIRCKPADIDSHSVGCDYIEGAYPSSEFYLDDDGKPQFRDEPVLPVAGKDRRVEHLINELELQGYSVDLNLPDPTMWTKDDAIKAVNHAAGLARVKHFSPGGMQNEEYRLTIEQLINWRSAGSPADNIPRTLQSYIDSTGMTPEQAATAIEQANIRTTKAIEDIRDYRVKANTTIKACDDDSYVQIAFQFIDLIKLI